MMELLWFGITAKSTEKRVGCTGGMCVQSARGEDEVVVHTVNISGGKRTKIIIQYEVE